MAAPAAEMVTVPAVLGTNVPKFSDAAAVCVNTSGATTVAVAVPVAVEVLPAAKAALDENAISAAAITNFFIALTPKLWPAACLKHRMPTRTPGASHLGSPSLFLGNNPYWLIFGGPDSTSGARPSGRTRLQGLM